MKITKQSLENIDYWFDKTLERYVPNSKQKIEIETNLLKKGNNNFTFSSDMTVLFYSPLNHPNTYCKIQTMAIIDFASIDLRSDAMAVESIGLILKQQYQFCINIFRQNTFGTLWIPTNIDKKLINQEAYNLLKEKYKDEVYFYDENSSIPMSQFLAENYNW